MIELNKINSKKHTIDSDHMHPEDALIVFKLSDMKYPVAGRFRHFYNRGKFTEPSYVYVHRADGLILHKYSFGFKVLHLIKF